MLLRDDGVCWSLESNLWAQRLSDLHCLVTSVVAAALGRNIWYPSPMVRKHSNVIHSRS